MKNKVFIPRINYVAFELIKIDIKSQETEQEDVIYLAVKPSQFEYRLQGRDAIAQTNTTVFITKFSLAPEHCRISGTFGNESQYIAGTYMDGWSRLKQFQEDVVKKSKDVSIGVSKKGDYIYAINYYDFIFQKFGAINISNWQISGDAQSNTILPKYSCDFAIVGELIKTASKDYLLDMLQRVFGQDGMLKSTLDNVNNYLSVIEPYLSAISLPLEGLGIAKDLFNESGLMLQTFTSGSKKLANNFMGLY